LAAAIAASLAEMNLNQQRSTSSNEGYDVSAYRLPAATLSLNEITPTEAENIYKFSDIVDRIQQSGSDLFRERQVQV